MAKHLTSLELAWCRVATKLDIAETRAALTLGTLPIPAPDIPAPRAERIAEAVALDLARLAMETLP